jgi:hypothetical protein
MLSSLYNFRAKLLDSAGMFTVPQYIIPISEPAVSLMDICATAISQNVRDRLPT